MTQPAGMGFRELSQRDRGEAMHSLDKIAICRIGRNHRNEKFVYHVESCLEILA